jgi:predicted xylose isomerase-like sugar epimerase
MDKQRLTDAEAKRLLERASELDAEQADSLDIAQVREIATEAGISSAAVDAALDENVLKQQSPVKQWRLARPIRVVSRVALVLAVGYVLFAIVARTFP